MKLLFPAVLGCSLACGAAAEFQIGSHHFTLPEGFVIERAAGPELTARPIVADFDENGALYVAESSGSNEPVARQLEERPHRILRLRDEDGDGVFEKSTVFADRMMFPEGTMWHRGSLYVSAPPVIWRLTDTDGDGVADRREEWLDAKTLTGCANDLHGPYLGLDGWIYWCKGAFAKQTYEQPAQAVFETRAAHIFRRRPEGGLVEPVMTGGMDNPVDVTFTPEGERIFTTTFFQHPGGGQRDGLIHAIYGGVYGKVHEVIDAHKKTGDLMPVLTHLGPAAPSGLTRYESEAFGAEYRDNLFACLFNLHKVTRHVLRPTGASYTTENSDFVVSDNTDFHPTDVIEDADGSLLIVDTGGWYKLCCPTSQLWKPDVLGAIYRVRRVNAQKIADPRGLRMNWEVPSASELAARLEDSRPAVVKRAIQALREKNETAGELGKLLRSKKPESLRRNAVWALSGSKDSQAAELLVVALSDSAATVRHAALQAISAARLKSAQPAVQSLLKDESLAVRRAAAEALGRIGDASAVAPLLAAAGALQPAPGAALPDRVQEHSIIYALLELKLPEATRRGLASENSFVQRAALIALDQMSQSALTVEMAAPFLSSSDPVLRQTVQWVIAHRPDWAPALAGVFEQRLKQVELDQQDLDDLRRQLARLSGTAPVQALLASTAQDAALPVARRALALAVMSEARPRETPRSWVSALEKILLEQDPALTARAAETIASLHFKQLPEELRAPLSRAALSRGLPLEARLAAALAVAGGRPISTEMFEFLRANLRTDQSLAVRNAASSALAKAALTDEQLIALGAELRLAGPLELNALLPAYEKSTSEATGQALLTALKEARSFPALHPDRIRQLVAKYPEAIQARAGELAATLDLDAPRQSARIEALLPKLQNGDVRRGQAIFNSQAAACSSCHAIGYLGGTLGPDLTRIGQIRTERDLLEAILYPSASFVRSYEPVIVSTRDGEQYSGVLQKDAPDEMILRTGPAAEIRIARAEIKEVRPGKMSVMPQGLEEQMSEAQLADLLAFLKATRW